MTELRVRYLSAFRTDRSDPADHWLCSRSCRRYKNLEIVLFSIHNVTVWRDPNADVVRQSIGCPTFSLTAVGLHLLARHSEVVCSSSGTASSYLRSRAGPRRLSRVAASRIRSLGFNVIVTDAALLQRPPSLWGGTTVQTRHR